MLLASSGTLLLTTLTVEAEYATRVLPAMVLMGLGMGLTFTPVFATATAGVAPHDAGVTSATVNTAQQVGGSIGTALLNTIATMSSTAYVAAHLRDPAQQAQITREGIVHGYTVALWWSAGLMLLAGLIAALMVTAKAPDRQAPTDAPVRESVA
jgi:hypothetical protein